MDGEVERETLPTVVSEPFYTTNNLRHRWQGDIFSTENFTSLPSTMHGDIGLWMVMNRTCHMLEGDGRVVKIPKLVFCPVIPLDRILQKGKNVPTIHNQIKNLIAGKNENFGFLPEGPSIEIGPNSEHVVDFGAVLTQQLDKCPAADTKKAQLSSPFAEHLAQRFARYYSTIGYDDTSLRDKEYQAKLAKKFE